MEDLSICIISLVIIVFALFIIRIITLSIRNSIILQQLKQEARLRAQGNGTATCVTPNESASAGTAISTWDNPPTYENAMANYIDAKQQLRAMEEGAVDNAMAMTASTTTIETCITEVAASRTDLSANPAGAINTSNEAPKPMSQ
ncbi:PREDICTED: uncharacterized protein LOC108365068 isoform X2 [Rhagoletis zephyria]|uniref:uncharacterized protein LOC108365068 isoform X2 n=1 Tax=Rhagoletis zephyria TaxID=28612 RepID=UPI0008112462|nr:PREDICTED: uncharacterized protein LOC108365068 isoform X2 [Rhagoletis zephyria]